MTSYYYGDEEAAAAMRRELRRDQQMKYRSTAKNKLHMEALQRRADARAEKQRAKQEELCRRVSIGQSLLQACTEDKAMPGYVTALRWLQDNPDFAEAYRHAQRLRADFLFEEALTVADDARNDWMRRNDPNNPGWLANGEHIQRSKLRVDTRKWAAGKLNPSRYGDKLAVEGDPDKPVVVAVTHNIVQVVRQETSGPVIEAEAIEDVDAAARRHSDWDDD
jgi:hypothetical protein